jgi:hypothetical protein
MSAPKKIAFDTVRTIGLTLPDVEEGTVYGSPALKVRGKMFACLAIHRSAEPGSLVIRIDFDQRDGLITADPDTYYLTEHYVNYPCVLVRLSRVHRDALRDLLLMAWRFVYDDRQATSRPAKAQMVRKVRELATTRKYLDSASGRKANAVLVEVETRAYLTRDR